MGPGEYAIMVDAYEGTSMCRGGRRQVLIAPGEQPELLGVDPMPSDCNEGLASLAFELYGSGDYATSLMQGSTEVWSETLPAGEHVLEDIEPGDYFLKVQHTCLQTYEAVSLFNDMAPNVSLEYNGFVTAGANGGAWLEATCSSCETGEGYGYTWFLFGEEVGADAPLAFHVDQVGTYELELVTYGLNCQASAPFEITAGKYLEDQAGGLEWLGVHAGQLGVRFPEAWPGAEVSCYDALGRVISTYGIGDVLGETFIELPEMTGWIAVELRSADGKLARWTGIL